MLSTTLFTVNMAFADGEFHPGSDGEDGFFNPANNPTTNNPTNFNDELSHNEGEFQATQPGSFLPDTEFSSPDLDGDGSPDHIASIVNSGPNSVISNGLHVFNGVTGQQMFAIHDPETNDAFGYSVDGAGDVDGDGVNDLFVGAPSSDLGGTDAGQAHLYSGSDGAPIANFTSSNPRGGLGFSTSSPGDLDGDGLNDIMVSAPFDGAGKVSVFFSSSISHVAGAPATTLNTNNADLTFVGENTGDAFGHSISSAGDVDGDGVSDMIIGAPLNDGLSGDVNDNRGKAYVYSGATGALIKTISGTAPSQFLGFSVSRAGDVNHDGVDDVAVGAPGQPDVRGSGKTLVFFGDSSHASTAAHLDASNADIELTPGVSGGTTSDSLFGSNVRLGNDVDGDGTRDLIVDAASRGFNGMISDHRSYVFSGADTSLLQTKVATKPTAYTPTQGANTGFDQFTNTLSHLGQQNPAFSSGDLNLDGVVNSVDVALAMDAIDRATFIAPPSGVTGNLRRASNQTGNTRHQLKQQLTMLPDVLVFLNQQGGSTPQAAPVIPSIPHIVPATTGGSSRRRAFHLGG